VVDVVVRGVVVGGVVPSPCAVHNRGLNYYSAVSQRIRIGNTYQHTDHGLVVVVGHTDTNVIEYKSVVGRDNGGVISTDGNVREAGYKDFLGSVQMRDYPDDDDWGRLRKYVYHRDGGHCQGCGTEVDRSAPIHHICPLGAGGTNMPSNLLLLCQDCHGAVHRGPL